MARVIRAVKARGFTLVELLIVVAIIGVLSVVGVPTFRRMLQKAKKSEAKVALGGLYTAEQAFMAEYGGYGNYLLGLGYEMDGAATATYRVGFYTGGGCAGSGAIAPANGVGIGIQINNLYGAYYTGVGGAGNIFKNSADLTKVPPEIGSVTGNRVLATGQDCTAPVGLANFVLNGNAATAVDVFTTGTDNRFVAGAAGVVAPGVLADTPGKGNMDVWAIDEQRQLKNTQDGVK